MFALMLDAFATGQREEQNMIQAQGSQDDELCPRSASGSEDVLK